MVGRNDDIKRPLIKGLSRLRDRQRPASSGQREADIVSIGPADAELLDALKKIGEDILTEPTPKRLLDAIRNKKR